MKAATYHQYGGPEVLQIEEVALPQIGPDEALVRVRAAGLSWLDLQARSGLTEVKAPLPHIGGAEVAGEIVRLGENVTSLLEGQRVVISPFLLDSANTNPDEEVVRLDAPVLGLHTDGGHAEYVKAPGRSLMAIPEELTFEEAAAQSLTALTAWHALATKAGIRPGETVLVLGAGSGTGSAAIQVAKLWGTQVIAAASDDTVLEKAKELEADYVINYTKQDFAQEVLTITQGRGVDIVLEHVGQQTWPRSLAAVARNGRVVVCGTLTGGEVALDLSDLFTRQIMVLGSYGGSMEELQQVLRLTAEGRLQAVIDLTYPLDEIQAASERLASRQQFGKLILVP
jgi:NADPH:quinone reductase-like Zn-dependent oxidoreductase